MSGLEDSIENAKETVSDTLEVSTFSQNLLRGTFITIVVLLVLFSSLAFYWDHEPDMFDVRQVTEQQISKLQTSGVTGSTTVATMITMADVLLHKRGGYLHNDIILPSVLMDNLPNWEFGVLVQIRDMARTLRNNLSRSQSQSTEDADLVKAEGQFYFDNDSWVLPETESEYQKGTDALKQYMFRLGDQQQQSAQFYARADNLRTWLSEVETRLGSLSQRLSASVGKRQLDTSLAGDIAATQSTYSATEQEVKTSWTELDDVFYEARGTTWALLHLLRAVEVDFHDVLQKKNALISMQQIIRELEPTQDTLWSPVILNGSGFGTLANHSLVMGSHISRANAAIIDLRRLLEDG
ncbi:MAG: DUF2333 family protein [Gammaproteobacteria bacterium]|nr:DUF2333 family protein [Gammaproteobacteria bacterium]MBT3869930.1 DUF2333 family protein [Gammaproteobacteria bacterium]MBT4379049.1 DUF2333 family protein [Gammaproteobacteria bacterium]MBT4619412.1 DUF2333 family protein [Gammaproteobacteria bacterium]MBT5199445.1 DUF2333 family protein [Gammaproteobacteria bacterium]